MFKFIKNWWNARTPVWLHNGTKENIIFQIILAVMVIAGLEVRFRRAEHRRNKK